MAISTPENTEIRRGRAKTVLTPEHEALMDGYDAYLSKALPGQTARTYSSAVRVYLAWMEAGTCDGNPLADADARNWAVRDYKGYLLTQLKRSPATVNNALAALDNFYTHRGLGPA